jgi:hypothetical protein
MLDVFTPLYLHGLVIRPALLASFFLTRLTIMRLLLLCACSTAVAWVGKIASGRD